MNYQRDPRTVLPPPNGKPTPTPPPPPISSANRRALIEQALFLDAATRQAEPLTGPTLDITLEAWELALGDIPTARLDRALKRAIRNRPDSFPLATNQVLTAWQEDRHETPVLPDPAWDARRALPRPPAIPDVIPELRAALRERATAWGPPPTGVQLFQAAVTIRRAHQTATLDQLVALLDTAALGCVQPTLDALVRAVTEAADGS